MWSSCLCSEILRLSPSNSSSPRSPKLSYLCLKPVCSSLYGYIMLSIVSPTHHHFHSIILGQRQLLKRTRVVSHGSTTNLGAPGKIIKPNQAWGCSSTYKCF
jgi:hypothetical protein